MGGEVSGRRQRARMIMYIKTAEASELQPFLKI